MANEYKITDIIDEKAFQDVQKLREELVALKDEYVSIGKEMGKKVSINVSSYSEIAKEIRSVNSLMAEMGGIQEKMAENSKKITAVYDRQAKAAAEMAQRILEESKAHEKITKAEKDELDIQEKLNRQKSASPNTTNTISRELAEVEKLNAKKREEFKLDQESLSYANQILGTRRQNIESLAEYQRQMAELSASKKEVNEAFKSGTISESEYSKQMADILESQRALNISSSDLQQTLKIQEKLAQDSAGSYTELSHQLELMKKAYKSLNDEDKTNIAGKKLASEIQNLDAHLKDLAADMGEFQRNTGNYAIANGNVRKEMKELTMSIASLTIEYRNLTDAERNSERGQEMEQRIQGLIKKASDLKDTMADVNREIQGGASDTKGWDSLAGQIGLVTAGFAGVTAAGKAFGLEQERLNQVQTAAVAVLALANKGKELQNQLQKESAVMLGIESVKAKAAAMAITAKTAAEGKGVVATKAATIAQKAFNVVASANPYVLLATALVTVVGALSAFAIGASKAKDEAKSLNAELDFMSRHLQQLNDDMEFEAQLMEAEGASIDAIRKKRYDNLRAMEQEAHQRLEAIQANKKASKEDIQQAQKHYDDVLALIRNFNNQVTLEDARARTQAREDAKRRADEAAKAAAEAAKQKAMAEIRAKEEEARYLEDIEKQLRQTAIDIMDDGMDKEIAQIHKEYGERLAAIKGDTMEEIELKSNLVELEARAEMEIREKYAKMAQDAEQKAMDERIDAIHEAMDTMNASYEMDMNKEILALKKRYAEGKISKEEYEEELYRITTRYAQLTSEAEIKYLQMILSSEKLSDQQRGELSEELSKKQIECEEKVTDAVIRNNEKRKESLEKLKDYVFDTADQVMGLADMVGEYLTAKTDAQIQNIEREREAEEDRYNAEVDMIDRMEENGSISHEEAEARKRAAEDRSQRYREMLDNQQRALEKKKAQREKQLAIASAIINTARAVAECLPNLFKAALVAAAGAIEIATIQSTPIPGYKKGTKDHPGGPAIVGDGGRRELVLTGNSMWITPDTPTLVNLPKHAKVLPDIDSISTVEGVMSSMKDNYASRNTYQTNITQKASSPVSLQNIENLLTQNGQTMKGFMSEISRHFKSLERIENSREFDSYIKSRM